MHNLVLDHLRFDVLLLLLQGGDDFLLLVEFGTEFLDLLGGDHQLGSIGGLLRSLCLTDLLQLTLSCRQLTSQFLVLDVEGL